MPQFNLLVGRELTLVGTLFTQEGIIFGLLLILMILILAIASGLFPAFILSSFQTANVLKGNNYFINFKGKQRISAGGIRKFLVVVQYVVSVGMIISTSIIYSQMQHLKHLDLGFEEQNILVVNTPQDTTFKYRKDDFLAELKSSPGILGVSHSDNVPAYTYGRLMFSAGTDTSNQHYHALGYFGIDENFFKVLDIPLIDGRFFYKESDDTTMHFIINEAAVAFMGIENPVGEKMFVTAFGNHPGEIIGVVKNFHFFSLHSQVEPLVFLISKQGGRYIIINIDENNKGMAMAYIEGLWNKHNPGFYMHHTFLNEKIDSLYESDQKMLSLFIYFSIFVIFISSLGLYGLSSFLIEQRTKEITVRKILGGSDRQIILLLAKDFLLLVFLAGIIASPIIYFLMDNWLNSFAYHITITGWYFVFGILIALLFAFCTVLIRSYNVVKQNPATALKYA